MARLRLGNPKGKTPKGKTCGTIGLNSFYHELFGADHLMLMVRVSWEYQDVFPQRSCLQNLTSSCSVGCNRDYASTTGDIPRIFLSRKVLQFICAASEDMCI